MRGRGNNNNNNNNNNNGGGRKGPNPLTRSYESNGPDVKIRGSAQQIAEKYTTLARDAQSSGDRVMAENYLQHAEHYNRIIMAAQAQMPQQQQRDVRDDDDSDEDGEEGNTQAVSNERHERNDRQDRNERSHQPQQQANGSGPQPVIEGVPAEVALNQQTVSNDGSDQENAPQPERGDAPRGRGRGRGRTARAETQEQEPQQDAVAEQPADAQDASSEAADDQPARKPRRPRRPRLKAGEEGASNDDQSSPGSDEPVTEAAQ